jgi:hypothetical protein
VDPRVCIIGGCTLPAYPGQSLPAACVKHILVAANYHSLGLCWGGREVLEPLQGSQEL